MKIYFKKFFILSSIFFIFLFNSMAFSQKEIFYLLIPADLVYGDMKVENFKNLIDEIIKTAKKQFDINFEVKVLGSSEIGKYRENREIVFKELTKFRGATMFGSPLAYIEAEEKKIPIKPYVSLSIDEKNTFRYCFYVNKESGIKNLSQLKDKKINAVENSAGSLLILREMLAENGFDIDIDKFFQKPVFFSNDSIAYNALVDERIDCVFGNVLTQRFATKSVYAPEYITPLLCSKEYRMVPILASKPLNKEEESKIEENIKFLKNIINAPELSKFSSILKSFGASFAEVTEKDYDDWRTLYKKAKIKKWLPGIERWEKFYYEGYTKIKKSSTKIKK